VKRDWGLFFAGLGIAVISACVAVPPALSYRPEPEPCPEPSAGQVLIDGCYREPGGFDHWISQPGIIAFLVVALVLLLVALAVMRRGLKLR
jgi:hypothetical protein